MVRYHTCPSCLLVKSFTCVCAVLRKEYLPRRKVGYHLFERGKILTERVGIATNGYGIILAERVGIGIPGRRELHPEHRDKDIRIVVNPLLNVPTVQNPDGKCRDYRCRDYQYR